MPSSNWMPSLRGNDEWRMTNGKCGKMKIGIYGGSFNPVHYGHVGLADWIVGHTDMDEVWLMVSPNNPLKDPGMLADEKERLAGVQEAIQGHPGLRACDFEFTLPRPSYTAHTMRRLRETFPEHTFSLIIGEDNIAVFTRWREWEWLINNFPIYVYPRGKEGEYTDSLPPELKQQIIYLKGAPLFDISSTRIREQRKKSAEK